MSNIGHCYHSGCWWDSSIREGQTSQHNSSQVHIKQVCAIWVFLFYERTAKSIQRKRSKLFCFTFDFDETFLDCSTENGNFFLEKFETWARVCWLLLISVWKQAGNKLRRALSPPLNASLLPILYKLIYRPVPEGSLDFFAVDQLQKSQGASFV